jgi:hypothetical protein
MAYSSLDPTTGAPVYLDSDAPDPAVNPSQVAEYAAQVGTRLIGTTAQRTAYSYARDGLCWYDTTLDREYRHNGTGWVAQPIIKFGYVSAATDASGDVTVTHGLGAAPTGISVIMLSTGPVVPNQLVPQVNTVGSTTFKVRIQRVDAGMTAFGVNGVQFYWTAMR